MRSRVRFSFSAVWLGCGWLSLVAFAPYAVGQDMEGPSGDRPGVVPVMPPEAAEIATESPDIGAEEVFRYQAQWRALTDAGRYTEAAELASTWHTDAVVQYGEVSPAAAAALRYLGDSHLALNNAVEAANAYNEAVEMAERANGVFDPSLVPPLYGLGVIYLEQGDYEASVAALTRAKDITHRNQGIFNLEQVPIVEALTESYVGLRDSRQATREQQLLYGTAEKTYGENSAELVPALQKWAMWNARVGRMPRARRIFNRAIDILEENYGPNDLRIVSVLNQMARTFFDGSVVGTPRDGRRDVGVALRRSVEIYRNQEFVDHTDLLRQQARLGDWYMLAQTRARGMDTYIEAIKEAREAGLDDEIINAMFGVPRSLAQISTPLGLSPAQLVRMGPGPHQVRFEFDLDRNGRTRNVRAVSDTIGYVSIVKVLRIRLMTSTFRPRFVDGQPVPTFGVRVDFNVYPETDTAELAVTATPR